MGTVKCGFWKFKFIITPKEFREIFLSIQDIQITLCNLDKTRLDLENKMNEYYHYYFRAMNPMTTDFRENQSFAYSIDFDSLPTTIGFSFMTYELDFWNGDNRFRTGNIGLDLCYQKGIAITDTSGKYFYYEDIKIHQPQGYSKYEEITSKIKDITKLLRFSSNEQEFKPPIRISQAALEDLKKHPIFENNEFKFSCFLKKEKPKSQNTNKQVD